MGKRAESRTLTKTLEAREEPLVLTLGLSVARPDDPATFRMGQATTLKCDK